MGLTEQFEAAVAGAKGSHDYKAVEDKTVDRMVRGLEQQLGLNAKQVAEIRSILSLTYDIAFQSGITSVLMLNADAETKKGGE